MWLLINHRTSIWNPTCSALHLTTRKSLTPTLLHKQALAFSAGWLLAEHFSSINKHLLHIATSDKVFTPLAFSAGWLLIFICTSTLRLWNRSFFQFQTLAEITLWLRLNPAVFPYAPVDIHWGFVLTHNNLDQDCWICVTLAYSAGWLLIFKFVHAVAAPVHHFATSNNNLTDCEQPERGGNGPSCKVHGATPGPKSGHIWLRGFFRRALTCLIFIFFMHQIAGYGGEGSDPVMGVTETSVLHSDWTYEPFSDVKPHDIRPPACSASQSHNLTPVKKRSLKRAHKRACCQGLAWYKGRLYRPEDFHFMPKPDAASHALAAAPLPQPMQQPPKAASDMCHKIHGSKSRLTCMQWNVGGLSNHRLDEVKAWLSHNHIQVLTLHET